MSAVFVRLSSFLPSHPKPQKLTSVSPFVLIIHQRFTQSPVELGAITSLYAATAPEAEHLNGKVRTPRPRVFLQSLDLMNALLACLVPRTLGASTAVGREAG